MWKTTDGGKTWQNQSDGSFGGSIGAVAVAPSDSKIVYVGTGEKTWRGNVSSGDGMWKSTDAGKTWSFVGLPDSRHISRVRVHPQNPDVVYAAVMGHVSGPNEERGVYRSKDGGKSWQRVLFANPHAGAVDLCLAPDGCRRGLPLNRTPLEKPIPVRRVCAECKNFFEPGDEVVRRLGLQAAQVVGMRFAFGKGCQNCNFTGYRGRMAITEILDVDARLREMILQGASTTALQAAAVENGLVTLRETGHG